MVEPWIQTHSRGAFDLLEPTPEQINIDDIGYALSMLCRFNGHTDKFYSVAQHCVHVSYLVPPSFALAGLLHDAAEAYLGDVTKPLKELLPDYQEIERNVERVIAQRFGLDYPMYDEVRAADALALAIEKRDLLGIEPRPWGVPFVMYTDHPIIQALRADKARARFMDRAYDLLGIG